MMLLSKIAETSSEFKCNTPTVRKPKASKINSGKLTEGSESYTSPKYHQPDQEPYLPPRCKVERRRTGKSPVSTSATPPDILIQ